MTVFGIQTNSHPTTGRWPTIVAAMAILHCLLALSTHGQTGVQLNTPLLNQSSAAPLSAPTMPPETISSPKPTPRFLIAPSIAPSAAPASPALPKQKPEFGTRQVIPKTPSLAGPPFSQQFIPNNNSAAEMPGVPQPINPSGNDSVVLPVPNQSQVPNANGAPMGISGNVETIKERYENGTIRIERQVILDKDGNYVNHGYWKFYLKNGKVAGQAFFVNGAKTGAWSRWVIATEAPALAKKSFQNFKPPFLSTFHYDNDQLSGPWRLTDSGNRTLCEIGLKNGQRDSKATWFHANGTKSIEMQYANGKLHGPFRRWNPQGKIIENREFAEGQEIGKITEFHRPEIKKIEYGILAGEIQLLENDQPWEVIFAIEEKGGPNIKHGPVKSWYSNGQLQLIGNFDHDSQKGDFIWFFQNGQKQDEGRILSNVRQGAWSWWHPNGMKASSGAYLDGAPSGNWQWWQNNGKLSRSKDYGDILPTGGDPAQAGVMQNAGFKNQ